MVCISPDKTVPYASTFPAMVIMDVKVQSLAIIASAFKLIVRGEALRIRDFVYFICLWCVSCFLYIFHTKPVIVHLYCKTQARVGG